MLYSNTAARQLFGEGRKLEGERFTRYLDVAPAPLREAIERGGDTLFTLELAGEPQVYHVSQRRFLLNAQPHRLLMLKQLTREINSQEVATWKKVIRVIAHELNNSLAPISSLAHSGQILARSPPDAEQLIRVFATIEERARHLAGFIEGYSQFAKLPHPRLAPVSWDVLLERLRAVVVFTLVGPPPQRAASFDTAQIEQALINLLKNARESGSEPDDIELAVSLAAQRLRDRGSRSRPGIHGGRARERAGAVLLDQGDRHRTGPNAVPRDRRSPRGPAAHRQSRGGGAVVSLWLPDGA